MLKALDIMSHNVVKIRGSATVAEAVQLMKRQNCRSLIVDRRNEKDEYGIVTETDVMYKVVALGKDPEAVIVAGIMTKPCITVIPSTPIEELAHLFAEHKLLRTPVIQGKVLGMITASDLLRYYPAIAQPHLEEELSQARRQAYEICTEQGEQSPACKTAWDTVEALQSEVTHQHMDKLLKHTLEEYCDEFPEGTHSEFYANLCGG
jgi:CBS domain-containing protein